MSKTLEITKALELMFLTFDVEVKPQVVKVYLSLLSGYETEKVKKAIGLFVRTSKFKPTPAGILEYLREQPEDIEARAITQLAIVERCVRRNEELSPDDDRITSYLVTTRWSLSRLMDMSEDDFKFFRHEFTKAYVNFTKSPAAKEMAESTGAIEFNDEIKSIANGFSPEAMRIR